jgi:hypothetical protein
MLFHGCTSLSAVTIPDTVTAIDENAFFDCRSLTAVTVPDSVTVIGACAFQYCTALSSATVPASVTAIGNSAFINHGGLTMYGYSDTCAESYAEKYEIPFVALDRPLKAAPGDMNSDGMRDLKDIVLLRRAIANGDDLSDRMDAVDLDRSGTVDLKDVVLLRRAIAGGWGVEL